jgi:hypothetical protein
MRQQSENRSSAPNKGQFPNMDKSKLNRDRSTEGIISPVTKEVQNNLLTMPGGSDMINHNNHQQLQQQLAMM